MTKARTVRPQYPAFGHHMFVPELGPLIAELLQTQTLGLAIFALIEVAFEPLLEMRLPKSAQNLTSQFHTALAHDLFSSERLAQRENHNSRFANNRATNGRLRHLPAHRDWFADRFKQFPALS